MSRSHKKAILKDRPRNSKKSSDYWKPVRRVNNAIVKGFKKELEEDGLEGKVKSPKEIVNDYDYSDYIVDYENILDDYEQLIKYRRK